MRDTSLAGRSILVVDDEDVFLRSVVEGLAGELPGVELHTGHNGHEALMVLEQNLVDLVVTDVNMPVMDGLALVAAMVSRGLRVPVVMVTAYGNRRVDSVARSHGVITVIDKPIDFPSLVETCRSTLRSVSMGGIGGVTLAGLLQLLELESRSATVRVFAEGGRSGRICIEGGLIVGCNESDQVGMEALREILRWREPSIEMGPLRTKERCPPMPLQAALLDAARQEDEQERDFLDDLFDEDGPPVPSTDELAELTEQLPQPEQPPPTDDTAKKERPTMANIDQSITAAMNIQGCIAAALVDHESGMCLGSKANGFPIEVAAAGNTEVLRAKLRVMNELGLSGGITDMLITLDEQYHLIVPLRQGSLFLYVSIDRKTGNLAMARHKLAAIEKSLVV